VNESFVDQNGLLYCPFLLVAFTKLGKRATYAHIIPKSEQTILTKKQDVVHHPGNLVPTIDTIHEQMELHQSLPGLTLDYKHSLQDGKDVYEVCLAPHITGEHMLIKCGVSAGQNVTMPTASRQFWQIHKQVFDLCHRAKHNMSKPQHMQTILDTVLSTLVINHIALPIIQRLTIDSLKQGQMSSGSSMLCPQRSSFATLFPLFLKKRAFQLRSSWWKSSDSPKKAFYNIDILSGSRVARTFDIVSRDYFKYIDEYNEIVRIYKGRYIAKYREMIYVIGFDDLVKNLKPGTLNALLNEPRDAEYGVTDVDGLELTQIISSGTSSVEHINDGFPVGTFSRKKQKKGTKPIISPKHVQRGTLLAEDLVTTTNRDTPPTGNCRQPQRARERTRHLQDDTLFDIQGISRGSSVKILATAKMHVGEIWVVDDIEHHLEGTRSIVHYAYLKSQDGSKTFKIQSVFLQPYTVGVQGGTMERMEVSAHASGDEAAEQMDRTVENETVDNEIVDGSQELADELTIESPSAKVTDGMAMLLPEAEKNEEELYLNKAYVASDFVKTDCAI